MDKNNKNNSNAFSFNEGTYTKNLKSKYKTTMGKASMIYIKIKISTR
jgi:hypothetical protein